MCVHRDANSGSQAMVMAKCPTWARHLAVPLAVAFSTVISQYSKSHGRTNVSRSPHRRLSVISLRKCTVWQSRWVSKIITTQIGTRSVSHRVSLIG